jgi:hypothetical protein
MGFPHACHIVHAALDVWQLHWDPQLTAWLRMRRFFASGKTNREEFPVRFVPYRKKGHGNKPVFLDICIKNRFGIGSSRSDFDFKFAAIFVVENLLSHR